MPVRRSRGSKHRDRVEPERERRCALLAGQILQTLVLPLAIGQAGSVLYP
jgi:hypothetical protein